MGFFGECIWYTHMHAFESASVLAVFGFGFGPSGSVRIHKTAPAMTLMSRSERMRIHNFCNLLKSWCTVLQTHVHRLCLYIASSSTRSNHKAGAAFQQYTTQRIRSVRAHVHQWRKFPPPPTGHFPRLQVSESESGVREPSCSRCSLHSQLGDARA